MINEHLRRTGKSESDCGDVVIIRKRTHCKDGFSISIQASEYHYCEPRVTGAYEYESVELGYPSEEEPLIMEYVEDPTCPTDTVYGYVPVEVVNEMIMKHGGIVYLED